MSPAASASGGAHAAAELLARAGWLDLLEDIHGGLCHDLNSRISSVEGLLQILELRAADVVQTLAYLGPEAERLEAMGALFAHLSGRVDAPPETFDPCEIVAAAAALLSRHRKLSAQEIRLPELTGAAPVRGCRPRLLRVLLLVLGEAGSAAHAAGAGPLLVQLAGEDGTVSVRVCGAEEPAGAWRPRLHAATAEPLAALLALDGGTLLSDEDAVGIRLPALGGR